MAAPAKFMFDMDFSAPDKAREKAATQAEIAQKVAAAEARAHRDGFAAGQREAKAESDRRAREEWLARTLQERYTESERRVIVDALSLLERLTEQ